MRKLNVIYVNEFDKDMVLLSGIKTKTEAIDAMYCPVIDTVYVNARLSKQDRRLTELVMKEKVRQYKEHRPDELGLRVYARALALSMKGGR